MVCDIEMKKTAAIAAVARDTGVTLSMDWVVFDYCFVIYNLVFTFLASVWSQQDSRHSRECGSDVGDDPVTFHLATTRGEPRDLPKEDSPL